MNTNTKRIGRIERAFNAIKELEQRTFSEKVHEAGTEFVIVHTAIFYNRINEAHTGIICYYE